MTSQRFFSFSAAFCQDSDVRQIPRPLPPAPPNEPPVLYFLRTVSPVLSVLSAITRIFNSHTFFTGVEALCKAAYGPMDKKSRMLHSTEHWSCPFHLLHLLSNPRALEGLFNDGPGIYDLSLVAHFGAFSGTVLLPGKAATASPGTVTGIMGAFHKFSIIFNDDGERFFMWLQCSEALKQNVAHTNPGFHWPEPQLCNLKRIEEAPLYDCWIPWQETHTIRTYHCQPRETQAL